MERNWHHPRLRSTTVAQRRLLYKISPVELWEKAKDVLSIAEKKPEDAEAQVSGILSVLSGEDQGDLLDTVKEQFGTLDAEVKQTISQNLQALTATATGLQLGNLMNAIQETLLGESEESKVQMPKGSTADSPTQEPGMIEGLWNNSKEWWNESSVNWKNWSPETKQTIGNTATVLGVVAAGVALYNVGSWLFGTTKKAVNTTVSTAKTTGKNILFYGTLIVGGIAAFMGWRYLQGITAEWKAKLETASGYLEKLKGQRDALVQKIDSVVDPEERKRIAAEIRRIDDRIDEGLKKGKKTVDDVKKFTQDEENRRKAKEEAEKLANSAKYRFFPKIVVQLTEGVTYGGMSADTKAVLLGQLIALNERNGTTMRDVFGYNIGFFDNPAGSEENPFVHTPDGDVELAKNRRLAVDILLRFCKDNRDRVRKKLMAKHNISSEEAEEKMNALPVFAFIELCLSSPKSTANVLQHLRDAKGSFVEKVQSLDLASIVSQDPSVEEHVHKFAQETLGIEDKQLEDISIFRLMQLALDANFFGPDVQSAAAAPLPKDASQEMILLSKIFKEIRDGDTYKYLIPAFHDVLPTHEEGTNAEIVQRYLLSRMPLDKALRFFIYRRMMDNGQAAGLFFLQMEIIKFIADEDEGTIFKTKRSEVILQILEKVGGASAEKLAEGWEALGIEISPDVFMQGARMLGIAAALATKLATTWYMEWLSWPIAQYRQHPLWTTLGVTGAGLSYRWIVGQRMNPEAVKIGLKLWAGGKDHGSTFARTGRMARMLGTPLLVSQSDDIVKCSANYTKLYDSIYGLADEVVRADLMESLRKASISSHNTLRWAELASQLRANGLEPAADVCDEFARSWRLRSVLHRAIFNSDASVHSWLGLKKPLQVIFRMHNALYDFTVGKALSYVGNAGRVSRAIAIADESVRIARYGTMLKEGVVIDELLRSGAKVDDLLKLSGQLEVADVHSLYRYMSEAQKMQHPELLVRIAQGRTAAELGASGLDLAEAAVVMRRANEAKLAELIGNGMTEADAVAAMRLRNTSNSALFTDDLISSMDDLSKDSKYLEQILSDIASVEDDAVRLARLQAYRNLLNNDARLLRLGADAADMISSGAPSTQIIDACLATRDVAVRQFIMAELLTTKHADDLLNAMEARGAQFADDVKAIASVRSGFADDILLRIQHFGGPVPVGASGAADEVLEVGRRLTTAILLHPEVVKLRPTDLAQRAQFQKAVERCAGLVDNANDAAKLLSRASTYDMLVASDDVFAYVQRGIADTVPGAGRVQAVEGLSSYVSKALRNRSIGPALLDDSVLSAVARAPISHGDNLVDFIRANRFLAKNPERLARFIRFRGAWYGSSGFARNAIRLGVGMEVAFAFISIEEYKAAKAHVERLHSEIDDAMIQAGFTKGGTTYTHPNGSTLSVTNLHDVIDTLDDPEEAMAYFQGAMAAVSASTFLIAPQILAGPFGWALLGLQLSATYAKSYADQMSNRTLFLTLPPSVVALLGTQPLVHESEADVTASASNWVKTDGISEDSYEVEEKEEIRKKAYLALFHRSLLDAQGAQPELYNAIVEYLPGQAKPEHSPKAQRQTWAELYAESGELFNGDYKHVLRRVLAMSLFQSSSDSSVDWKEFRHLRTDEGSFDWENVTQEDWQQAAQQSLFFYGLHRMELRAIAANKAYAEAIAIFNKRPTAGLPVSALTDEQRASRIQVEEELGLATLLKDKQKFESQRIFGKPIREILRDDGRTTIEVLLEKAEKRLNTAANKHGSERHEMRAAGNLFAVALPEALRPDARTTSVNINQLSFLAMDGMSEGQEKQVYTAFCSASADIAAALQYVGLGRNGGGMYAQGNDFRAIQNFRAMLVQMPESFDKGGQVRHIIEQLDSFNWDPGIPIKDSQMHRRTEKVRELYVALRTNNAHLQRLHWRYNTIDRTDRRQIGRTALYDDTFTDALPAGRWHDMSDVENHAVVFFTPRTADGSYATKPPPTDENGRPLRVQKPEYERIALRGIPGQKVSWQFPPEGDAQANLAGMHGIIECLSTGEGKFHWRFIATEPSQVYYFTENSYGIEQPGMNAEFDVITPREEILHPSTRSYVHPRTAFRAVLRLQDGTTQEVRCPPIVAGEKTGRDHGSFRSKEDFDSVVSRFADLGITASPIKSVNTTSRYLLKDDSEDGEGYYYLRDSYGWNFSVDTDSPVTHIEFTNNALAEKDLYKEQLAILPDEQAQEELAKRRAECTEPPVKYRESDRLITSTTGTNLYIERQDFNLTIVLADGRVVRGDQDFPLELQRYVEFKPVAPTDVSNIEWINGAWVNVERKEVRGWHVYPRNPDDVAQIIHSHPDSTHRTVFRFTEDGSMPKSQPEDTQESVLYSIDADAFARQQFIVSALQLRMSETSEYYESDRLNGKFYPRSDGSVYWTGQATIEGEIVPSMLYRAEPLKGKKGQFTLKKTAKRLDPKSYELSPERIANPKERRAIAIENERTRRATVLAQVRKLVPSLRQTSSGSYWDSETSCVYDFRSDGYFHRSWGGNQKTFAYIPPARFENGTWVEQEDPVKEDHIYDLQEEKKAEQKRKKRAAERAAERAKEPEEIGYDPEMEKMLQTKVSTETLAPNAAITLNASSSATIICTLADGSEQSFYYRPERTGLFGEGEKQPSALLRFNAEDQKKFEAAGLFAAFAGPSSPEVETALFTITKKLAPKNTTLTTSSVELTLGSDASRIESIRIKTAGKDTTYKIDRGDQKKAA